MVTTRHTLHVASVTGATLQAVEEKVQAIAQQYAPGRRDFVMDVDAEPVQTHGAATAYFTASATVVWDESSW